MREELDVKAAFNFARNIRRPVRFWELWRVAGGEPNECSIFEALDGSNQRGADLLSSLFEMGLEHIQRNPSVFEVKAPTQNPSPSPVKEDMKTSMQVKQDIRHGVTRTYLKIVVETTESPEYAREELIASDVLNQIPQRLDKSVLRGLWFNGQKFVLGEEVLGCGVSSLCGRVKKAVVEGDWVMRYKTRKNELCIKLVLREE
jgi:hypothetical protein